MNAAADAPVTSYVAAAAPPGSIDYFALLFSPASRREALGSALALGKVVRNIAAQEAEGDILRLKLAWWHDEVRATRAGAPRHPLTRDLAGRIQSAQWLRSLERIVDETAASLTRQRPESLEAILREAHGLAERQTLISIAGGAEDDQALATALAGGVGIGLVELLFDPGGSRSRLRADDAAPQPGAADLAAIAVDHFDAMQSSAHSGERQSTVWLQAQLYREALERLARARYDAGAVAHRPLRLLWRAWCEARRLRA